MEEGIPKLHFTSLTCYVLSIVRPVQLCQYNYGVCLPKMQWGRECSLETRVFILLDPYGFYFWGERQGESYAENQLSLKCQWLDAHPFSSALHSLPLALGE
ncbi:UNVERIFIED_CONTAM: hypothetical protein K2H54_020721 [Gekko kuhli]